MKFSICRFRPVLGLAFVVFAGLSYGLGQARLMTVEQAQEWQKEEQKEREVFQQSDDFDHSNDRATLVLLSEIKIDGVNWVNQDVQWALNDLAARATGQGAPHLKFIIRWPKDPRQPDRLGRSMDRDISFATNEKMSLLDLLRGVICRESNLSFHVDKDQVIFMPWQPGNFVYLHALMDPM